MATFLLRNKNLIEWSQDEEVSKTLFLKHVDNYLFVFTVLAVIYGFDLIMDRSLELYSNAMICTVEDL